MQGCMYRVEKPFTEFVCKVAEGQVKPEEPNPQVSDHGIPSLPCCFVHRLFH
jgi:hypothetical protein